ncbi:hypothetical protein LTR53_002380 [Teratosphaeriaceae sp. CCFEE 6253]|nr:hypothetical protein LTR53_002380 [Teratosphaeriaceae sp. CCFEE 6253]
MAHPNPTINPPALSSSRPPLHSRSPSRSPVRQIRDADPLLRGLSPTATLRAFHQEQAGEDDSACSDLAHSFAGASSAERALGIRAAQVCLDVRSWTRELDGWEWPGTFDVPEPARKRMRMSAMSLLSIRTAGPAESREDTGASSGPEDDEFWGSLPGKTVQAYERRADEIAQEVEKLDVEELKVFVLGAHRQTGNGNSNRTSLDDSFTALGERTDFRRLDDFTALITATILQALPYLARLHHLLDVWTIRLGVLRQTPAYLQDLKQARTDLDHGWAAIAVSSTSGNGCSSANFTRHHFVDMKGVVDGQVNSLGRRLDSFLDDLEGRDETVPEAWIEEYETLESAYGDWVVQAERKMLENEWRTVQDFDRATQKATLIAPEHGLDRGDIESFEMGSSNGDEQVASTSSTRQTSRVFIPPLEEQDQSLNTAAPSIAQQSDLKRVMVPSYDFSDHGSTPVFAPRPSRPNSRVFIPSLEEQIKDFAPIELPREDSQTLPEGDTGLHQPGNGVPLTRSTSAQPLESPTKLRGRYMPIVIDYSNPDSLHPSQPTQDTRGESPGMDVRKEERGTASPQPSPPSATSVAKKRAAFLGGDVEKAERLQRQAKSPVRPFEHASNAFTRLFKKDKTPEPEPQTQSQPDARRSTLSLNAAKSGSKRNSANVALSPDGVLWGGRKRVSSTPGDAEGTHVGSPSASRSSLPPPVSNSVPSATADPRETYSRSRSTSQRSSSSRTASLGGALVDAVPISLPRQKSFQRDYIDLPGGFRSRSSSDGSRRTARAATSPREYEGNERRLERLPEIPVETYQPSGRLLQSPPDGDKERGTGKGKERLEQYPVDWPLASPPQTTPSSPVREMPGAFSPRISISYGTVESEQQETVKVADDNDPETYHLHAPPDTDAFDRIFVSSLPATPPDTLDVGGPPLARDAQPKSRSAMGLGVSRQQSSRSQVPTLDESMLGREEERWSAGVTGEDAVSGGQPQDTDGADAPGGRYSGVEAGAGPVHPDSNADGLQTAHSPTSPLPLKLEIPSSPNLNRASSKELLAVNGEEGDGKRSLLHRASIASIESHPRSAVRSIDVARRASQGSNPSVPQTPVEPVPNMESASGAHARRAAGSPLNYKGLMVFPTPPSGLANSSVPVSPVSPISRRQSPTVSRIASSPFGQEKIPDSPVSARSDNGSPAPLNAAMGKRQVRARPGKAAASSSAYKKSTPLKPGEDSFDRHVSDVLDRLPSQAIKFKARPGATTPSHQRTAEPRNYSGPRPNGSQAATRAETIGGLTLAPAEASSKKSSSAVDDVKLYHLRQAGREEPIKLFVRLVGEGERVMVRVGGGWADLADYLRQYAEHHGSRTVSGGGIELHTAQSAGNSSRKVSGSTAAGAAELKANHTPTTPVAAAVPGRPASRAAEMNWLKLDDDDSSPADDGTSPVSQLSGTPHAIVSQRATPKSASTKAGSRPSTADSVGRPGSRQAYTTEAGLAGRSAQARRADLPEQKARWVEGMLEKAKAASAEKTQEGKKYFGELGKAGGTRRMIFRQSSTATTGGGSGVADENGKP